MIEELDIKNLQKIGKTNCVKIEGFNKRGLEGWKARGIAEKFKSLKVTSLRASVGCVAIQLRLLHGFTGLLRWHRRSLKPQAEVLCIGAAQPPRNDNKVRSTLNELTTNDYLLTTKRTAFTMAEILLSLTIIGVVAAITLPSLTGNINERTWNTQRKALFSRMSQAISLMPAVNGYGAVRAESEEGAGDAVDTAAETFVTNGLSKVLQINNICGSNFSDCGIPAQITTASAEKINFPTTMGALNNKMAGSFNNTVKSFTILDTKAAAFETKNGESIVVYTNPYCIGSLNDMVWGHTESGGTAGTLYQRTVCANFIYDLNGKKGPNTVGKDIGVMTVMYPSDPVVVAPNPAPRSSGVGTYSEAVGLCTSSDPEYRLPNLEETYSMFVNKKLLQPSDFTHSRMLSSHLTTRPNSSTKVIITTTMGNGEIDDWTIGSNTYGVWCVKR